MAGPLQAPESDWMWLHVPLSGEVRGVICGEIGVYYTHWYVPPGGKRPQCVRCTWYEAGACDWCTAAHQRRTRYVVPLLLETGVRLLELGRTAYPVLTMLREEGGEVGYRICVTRERPHKNAPLVVLPAGRGHVSPEQVVDVSGHVRSLGRQALALLDAAPPSKRSPEAEGALPVRGPERPPRDWDR